MPWLLWPKKLYNIKYKISGLLEFTVDLVWKYFTTRSYVKNWSAFVVSVFEKKLLKYFCLFITMLKFNPPVVATFTSGDHNLNKWIFTTSGSFQTHFTISSRDLKNKKILKIYQQISIILWKKVWSFFFTFWILFNEGSFLPLLDCWIVINKYQVFIIFVMYKSEQKVTKCFLSPPHPQTKPKQLKLC